MDYKESLKTFSEACIEHGFKKSGKIFSRCIGDAIYQIICIDKYEFIRRDSPEFSPDNYKSPYISFNFWSMYSDLMEDYFDKRIVRYLGEFYPDNLDGKKFNYKTFYGFNNHCEIMINKGLDFLDSITTQQKLLEADYQLQIAQDGCENPHKIVLSIPNYLFNRDCDKALKYLNSICARNYVNFTSSWPTPIPEEQYERYFEQEQELRDRMKDIPFLINAFTIRDDKAIRKYASECLEKNILAAKKNKVPFMDSFNPIYTV